MATVQRAEGRPHRRKAALEVLRQDITTVIGTERYVRGIEVTAQATRRDVLPLLVWVLDEAGQLVACQAVNFRETAGGSSVFARVAAR